MHNIDVMIIIMAMSILQLYNINKMLHQHNYDDVTSAYHDVTSAYHDVTSAYRDVTSAYHDVTSA